MPRQRSIYWLPLVENQPPEARRWTLKPAQSADTTWTLSEELGRAETRIMDQESESSTTSEPQLEAQKIGTLAQRIDSESGLRPLRHLGSGGMGDVVLMHQQRLGRPVAVKFLHERRRTSQWMDQFKAEVRTTSLLEHPAVVPVHDAGDDYLVMKCVDGQTFTERLEEHPFPPISELVEVLVRVGDCLGFAHDSGIIHRDIKPDNIMVGDFGETYLMDWGLALAVGDSAPPDLPHIDSEVSVCAGTPAYLPPECACGERENVSYASDVFGLAAVLYEVLTGRAPFEAEDANKSIDASAECAWQPLSELAPEAPSELATLCESALAAFPEDRPKLSVFVSALRRWLQRSGDRIEAERLSSRALKHLRDGVNQTKPAAAYRSFQRAADLARRVVDLAPELSAAARCAEQARFSHAKLAYEQGDLILARTVLGDLDNSGTGPAVDLRLQIQEAIADRKLRERQTAWLTRVAKWLLAVVIILSLLFPGWRYVEQGLHEQERRDQALDMWQSITEAAQAKEVNYQPLLARAQQVLGLHPEPDGLRLQIAGLAVAGVHQAIKEQSPGLARARMQQAIGLGLSVADQQSLLGAGDTIGTIRYLEAAQSRGRAAERVRRQRTVTALRSFDAKKARGDGWLERYSSQMAQWDWEEQDAVTAQVTIDLVESLLVDQDPELRTLGARIIGAAQGNVRRGLGSERLAAAFPKERLWQLAHDPRDTVASAALREVLMNVTAYEEVFKTVAPILNINSDRVRLGLWGQQKFGFADYIMEQCRQWQGRHRQPPPESWLRLYLSTYVPDAETHPLLFVNGREQHLLLHEHEHQDARKLDVAMRLLDDHLCIATDLTLRLQFIARRSRKNVRVIGGRFQELLKSGPPEWKALAGSALMGAGTKIDQSVVDEVFRWSRNQGTMPIFPGVAEAILNLARVYEREANLALVVAMQNAQGYPHSNVIQHQFARGLFEVGALREALEVSWLVNSRWPHLVLNTTLRAEVLLGMGKLDEASRLVDRAMRQLDFGGFTFHILGIHAQILDKIGREEDALSRYYQSVAVRRNNQYLQSGSRLAYRLRADGVGFLFDAYSLTANPQQPDAYRRMLRVCSQHGAADLAIAVIYLALTNLKDTQAVKQDIMLALPELQVALNDQVLQQQAEREAFTALAGGDVDLARVWLAVASVDEMSDRGSFLVALLNNDKELARSILDLGNFEEIVGQPLVEKWRRHLETQDVILPLPNDSGDLFPLALAPLRLNQQDRGMMSALVQELMRSELADDNLLGTPDPQKLEEISGTASAAALIDGATVRKLQKWGWANAGWRWPLKQQ